MRAIAFAILFMAFAQVVAHKNRGGDHATGFNVLALAALSGAVFCIIGGW